MQIFNTTFFDVSQEFGGFGDLASLDTNGIISLMIDIALRLIFAGLIMLIGFKLVNTFIKRMHRKKHTRNLDESAFSFVTSAVSIVLKVIVCITAASVLGVPLTAVVTLLSSCGLAIGLAMQGSLSNFAGGVMILIFRPFSVGDYISNHTDEGTVTDISIFYTTLRTPDNRRIVIPNGMLSNEAIINVSSYDTRRVEIPLTASYDSDISTVLDIIKSTAQKNGAVLSDPPIDARMTSQDASAISFFCRVWVKREDYWKVKFELTQALKEAFDENGIEIPYQQLDIRHRDAK